MYQYKYPHPALTTDCVVFGFDGKRLHVLLIERGIEPFKGSWALPGGFMRMDETAEQCAWRELQEETGVHDIYLEQFHTFSSVKRDPRERVVTVAFLALVRKSDLQLIAGDDAANASWFDIEELPPVAFDHYEIIALARKKLPELMRVKPIGFKLLDEKFTMPELQRLYEAINATTYDRRNFARKMLSTGLIHEDTVHDTILCDKNIHASISMPSVGSERKRAQYYFDSDALEKESKDKIIPDNPFNL